MLWAAAANAAARRLASFAASRAAFSASAVAGSTFGTVRVTLFFKSGVTSCGFMGLVFTTGVKASGEIFSGSGGFTGSGLTSGLGGSGVGFGGGVTTGSGGLTMGVGGGGGAAMTGSGSNLGGSGATGQVNLAFTQIQTPFLMRRR